MDDKNSSTSGATEATAPAERAHQAGDGGAVAGGAKRFSAKRKLAIVQRLLRGHNAPRKRGRGALKQPVFGVFERGGRVYTELIPDAKATTLRKVIRGKVALDAVLVSDGWCGYNGLVDVGYDRHLRINKSRHFAENGVHINGIESFWSFTKRRLAKFNGVKRNFPLHLEECEWRWGKDADTLFSELKQMMV